jgi:ABC-type branched-subunit amino acid transport system permease subunit
MNKRQIVFWCLSLFVGVVVIYLASRTGLSPRLFHLFVLSAIYSLVALALKISMGDGGVVFLGPTVPMGIAGYIVAKAAAAKIGVGLTLLLAPIGAIIISLVVFLPMLRASGLFLAWLLLQRR